MFIIKQIQIFINNISSSLILQMIEEKVKKLIHEAKRERKWRMEDLPFVIYYWIVNQTLDIKKGTIFESKLFPPCVFTKYFQNKLN